jgi:hypothetical protein
MPDVSTLAAFQVVPSNSRAAVFARDDMVGAQGRVIGYLIQICPARSNSHRGGPPGIRESWGIPKPLSRPSCVVKQRISDLHDLKSAAIGLGPSLFIHVELKYTHQHETANARTLSARCRDQSPSERTHGMCVRRLNETSDVHVNM